ncbi:MAG: hypothetical protein ACTIJ6_05290 [Leucobacter sp.]
MTDLDPYARMIERLSQRVDTKPMFRWATVTNIAPLLIQLDGDPAPLLGSPSNAGPKIYLTGERVRVELQNGRATIHSAANRVEDLRGTTAQRIDLALSGAAVDGMRFYDVNENMHYEWAGGSFKRGLPLPGTTLARAQKIGASSGTAGASTLTTVTGSAALSVPTTVDVATEVVIFARVNVYVNPSGTQIGTNQTGASTYSTPADDPSIGKASSGDDTVVESRRYTTLSPGTTNIRLAYRGGGVSLRNPMIVVQAV